MNEHTVLIAVCDTAMQNILCKMIKSDGLAAETVANGTEAMARLKNKKYVLLLAETELPGLDGFSLVEDLRRQGMNLPAILIGNGENGSDALFGLNLGADDYVVKPPDPVTLGAKIRALLRRSYGPLSEYGKVIRAGPFAYNKSTLRLYKNDREILLTGKENALMKLFLDHENRIFSKDMLYDMVWGSAIVDENTIMVYVNRLRKKIEDDPANPQFIQTVRGLGYRFTVT